MHNKDKLGFTLVELLTAMSIVAVLATILSVLVVRSSRVTAREAERKSDLTKIAQALELYYNDYTSYPLNTDDHRILACGPTGNDPCNVGEPWIDANGTKYLDEMPGDPLYDDAWYDYHSDGQRWGILAIMETESHPDIKYNEKCYPNAGIHPSKDKCNWGITFGVEIDDVSFFKGET